MPLPATFLGYLFRSGSWHDYPRYLGNLHPRAGMCSRGKRVEYHPDLWLHLKTINQWSSYLPSGKQTQLWQIVIFNRKKSLFLWQFSISMNYWRVSILSPYPPIPVGCISSWRTRLGFFGLQHGLHFPWPVDKLVEKKKHMKSSLCQKKRQDLRQHIAYMSYIYKYCIYIYI